LDVDRTRIALQTGIGRDGWGRVDDPVEMWQAVREYLDSATPAGAVVELRYVSQAGWDLGNAYDRAAHAVALAEDAVECERLGFDAVVMGPALDPGLTEARSVVDVPVIGSFEAAMAFSSWYGRRVGVVTVRRRYVAKLRENIRAYGLTERLTNPDAVRCFELDYTDYVGALRGDGSQLVERYAVAAEQCLELGADVIVGAHQLLGVAFARAGLDHAERFGVPYVDCLAAGVVGAAAAVGLRSALAPSASRHVNSIFRTRSEHDSDVRTARPSEA
jgi:allantoin racemase